MNNYAYLYISPDASLIKAFKQMDEVQHKLLIVVDNDTFVSLISVGDIQRYFIRTQDLNAPVKNHGVLSVVRKHLFVGLSKN